MNFEHPPVRPDTRIIVRLRLAPRDHVIDPSMLIGLPVMDKPGGDRKVGVVTDAYWEEDWVVGHVYCDPFLTDLLLRSGLLDPSIGRRG